MPLKLIRNDITRVVADAIVNSANPNPTYAHGTDYAIYQAAGAEELLRARRTIGRIERGTAVATKAFALKASYIIHTVGPKWRGGAQGEMDILRKCYRTAFAEAVRLKCKSIAFPLISAGTYGFPRDAALTIALEEINAFLMRYEKEMRVLLVVYDVASFQLSKKLFLEAESYIEDAEVVASYLKEYGLEDDAPSNARPCRGRLRVNSPQMCAPQVSQRSTSDTIAISSYAKDEEGELPFLAELLRILNAKNMPNSEVWKRANITRDAFSKLLCGRTKAPKKATVLGLCVALKLTVPEAERFLACADLAFNPRRKGDNLVRDCLERGQYNIDEINAMLFSCEQPQLGSEG